MLGRQYCTSPLINAKPSDPSYNILHMLPLPKHKQAYEQLLTDDLEVMQQKILDQSKKKKADTFMGREITSFEHILATLANNDMFTCFRTRFNNNGKGPLQVHLLHALANLLTLSETKEWYERFDKLEHRHMPFNIVTLCH